MQTIYVDFNTMQQFMDNHHVVIAQIDHPDDAGVVLYEHERVVVYDEEFSVEAVAYREANYWIGLINWSTRKARVPTSA